MSLKNGFTLPCWPHHVTSRYIHTRQLFHLKQWGFCLRLYHCGRIFYTLHTVIYTHILSLHSTDSQCEISSWPTATEPVWDSWSKVGHPIYEKLRRLSWPLQIPIQRSEAITMQETLTRPAGDGNWLSRSDRIGECSLGHHNIPSGSWNKRNEMLYTSMILPYFINILLIEVMTFIHF